MSTATASNVARRTAKLNPAGSHKGQPVRELKGHDAIPPKDKAQGKARHPGKDAGERKTTRVTIEGNNGEITVEPKAGFKKDDIQELRGESKRGKLLEALQSPHGITMGQACGRFEWKPRDFADALRLLANRNGVRSRRDEKGHWFVQK
jgi:hypothetical protein